MDWLLYDKDLHYERVKYVGMFAEYLILVR